MAQLKSDGGSSHIDRYPRERNVYVFATLDDTTFVGTMTGMDTGVAPHWVVGSSAMSVLDYSGRAAYVVRSVVQV